MTFRTINCPSLARRLSTVVAAPASVSAGRDIAALLDEYRSLGGDALHVHGEGGETQTREATGRWLRDRAVRGQMFVATQVGHAGWDEAASRPIRRLAAQSIAEDISENLALLGTDYLDFVYLSEDDAAADVGELLAPLFAERQRGRIRSFGVSEWSAERIRQSMQWARSHNVPGIAAVVTTELALATPSEPLWPEYAPFNSPLKQCVSEERLAVFAWLSDLNQGIVLFGARDPVTTMKPQWIARWCSPGNDAIVARVEQFAEQRSLDPRTVNSAYVLSQPFATIGIVALGAPHCADLATYAHSSQIVLSDADREWLERGRNEP